MTPDADQAFLPFPARVWRTPEQDRWRASDSDSGSESREGAKCRFGQHHQICLARGSTTLSGALLCSALWDMTVAGVSGVYFMYYLLKCQPVVLVLCSYVHTKIPWVVAGS